MIFFMREVLRAGGRWIFTSRGITHKLLGYECSIPMNSITSIHIEAQRIVFKSRYKTITVPVTKESREQIRIFFCEFLKEKKSLGYLKSRDARFSCFRIHYDL